jgi:hypothetical protein
MNNDILKKIKAVESTIKEIRDDLNKTKTNEKDKQIQTLLLEKKKLIKQNKDYLRLKQKDEEEIRAKYKYEQDKKQYKTDKYLSQPYNSMGDLKFDDLFNLKKNSKQYVRCRKEKV